VCLLKRIFKLCIEKAVYLLQLCKKYVYSISVIHQLFTLLRKHLLAISLIGVALSASNPVYAGEIIISGLYQGKNIFVQNPLSGDKKTYCANEVFVNDQKVISNIKLAAFEIDLSYLEPNDPVTIRITHKDGCAPRLINPQVIKPSAGFQIESVEILPTAIQWSTLEENPKFIYSIESLRNGNWVVLEKHTAKNEGKGMYSVPIIHPSGDNKYRIKAQNTDTHQTYYSRTITFNPDNVPPPPVAETPEPVTFSPENPREQLTLSREVSYEILDVRKKVILKGQGQKINLKTLKAGTYYLKVEEQLEKFVKKQ
jgi:hypothetical protein